MVFLLTRGFGGQSVGEGSVRNGAGAPALRRIHSRGILQRAAFEGYVESERSKGQSTHLEDSTTRLSSPAPSRVGEGDPGGVEGEVAARRLARSGPRPPFNAHRAASAPSPAPPGPAPTGKKARSSVRGDRTSQPKSHDVPLPHAFRLPPGADLEPELARITAQHALRAGFILTCVGSLSAARLRMPGAQGEPEAFKTFAEPLEIVSLVGTLSPDGLHLHIALSRRDGACIGGHLMPGCIVNTTVEVVIGEAELLEFRRVMDPDTGYAELSVRARGFGGGP